MRFCLTALCNSVHKLLCLESVIFQSLGSAHRNFGEYFLEAALVNAMMMEGSCSVIMPGVCGQNCLTGDVKVTYLLVILTL